MGAQYLLGLVAVAAFALRRDAVTAVLVAAFVASIFAAQVRSWPELMVWLSAIDSLSVVAMAALWTRYKSMRAWSAGFIGLAKAGLTLAAYGGYAHINFYTYALLLNCGFALQVIVAGGFVDAIGHRLDDLLRRVFPRRHCLLRNGRG